ncbi:MAG: radical SAM protein [Acidobacteria bacterium]|nr:radical SAM protein [Acidobacteriota bacterium]
MQPVEQNLIGIAKLAHQAPPLETKRTAEYRQLGSYSLLNRAPPHTPFFEWTINPYRGCEIGCKYCYARYTHEFMELRDPMAFEQLIFAKQWNPAAFAKELRRVRRGDRIAIGTATDPYQPAERRYGLTRSLLEVFAARHGYRLGITTKSDLVLRDLDLLQSVARTNQLTVHVTITAIDAGLARKIEPRAPRPDLRLGAVRKLAEAGIETGVFCCPVLPLINDSDAGISALAQAAKEAGARFLAGNTLFLRESAARVFLPFLDAEFPHLAGRYRARFAKGAFLHGAYPDLIARRFERARERFGFVREPSTRETAPWQAEDQLELFPEVDGAPGVKMSPA